MRLSRAGYFADFYVYPTVMTVMTAGALALSPPSQWAWVGLAILVGVGVWTFVEYQLHRWVLHHVPRIKDMHEAHHDDQMALIGTPTWLSALTIAVTVLLPSYLLVGLPLAAGFTVGLTLGYFFYVTVHHGVHHWKVRPGSYFFNLKRRHALHHHFDDMGNFGVTNGFWDKVFGTDIKVKDGRRARAAQPGA